MSKRLIACFLVALGGFLPLKVAAQPAICNTENPAMTSTCMAACIICDIDGFSGRHESSVPGVLPADFCTFTVHNAQWIAFQAASTDLRIRISVSNCDQGIGLELAIYRSIGCEQFEMISNCFGGSNRNSIAEGSSGILSVTEPLVIGQYYYLAMDGARADNCNWTFEVIEGSTEVSPLTVTAPIQGADRICPATLQTFTTAPETGAVTFDWTLDGVPIGDNTQPSVDLDIQDPGSYSLCVTARNACDEATPTCKTVEVRPIPPTRIVADFCMDDCYEFNGETFCETGIFERGIRLENGCDSLIILDLTRLEQPRTEFSVNICQGDTLFLGPTAVFTSGTFTELLENELMCDSIVQATVTVIECNIQSDFSVSSTVCHNESNGSVTFSVRNGTPPFSYTWQHLQTGLTGSTTISGLNEIETIDNLPAGDLVIQIDDNFGNTNVQLAQITEPDPIVLEAAISTFNGFGVSCFESADGAIELNPAGGQPTYEFSWSTGATTASINNLGAGEYQITLVDALGCEAEERFVLSQPALLSAAVEFNDPNCEGLSTGSVQVLSAAGGVGNFQFALNGSDFTSDSLFSSLSPGTYELMVKDANGCTTSVIDELMAPDIPVLSGEVQYTSPLACEIPIQVLINDVTIQSIRWRDTSYLDCSNCLDPIALPTQSGQNTILVSSEDGCVDSLTITINLIRERKFYAPTAFSPNFDGVNDRFSLFGGKEVAAIDLTVYNRWGGIVYSETNLPPSSPEMAWDGTFNFEPLNPGVYLWAAEIRFIDGFSNTYSGEVTLLR